MKTIDQYAIYCTEKQTKCAYKLGATIEIKTIEEAPKEWQGKACFMGMATCAKFPTAEQMCGWLREKNILINVCHNCDGYGSWLKKIVPSEPIGNLIGYFETEPQAILAAIDAALDYLEKGE